MKQKNHLSKEEERELDWATSQNPKEWELFCSACDNFETDACPFKGRVDEYTRYSTLRCQKFED